MVRHAHNRMKFSDTCIDNRLAFKDGIIVTIIHQGLHACCSPYYAGLVLLSHPPRPRAWFDGRVDVRRRPLLAIPLDCSRVSSLISAGCCGPFDERYIGRYQDPDWITPRSQSGAYLDICQTIRTQTEEISRRGASSGGYDHSVFAYTS